MTGRAIAVGRVDRCFAFPYWALHDAWLHCTNNTETNDKTAAVLFALGMSGACSLAVVLFAMTSLAGLFTGIKSDTTAGELLSTALLGLAVTPVLKVCAAVRTYFVFAFRSIATSSSYTSVWCVVHRPSSACTRACCSASRRACGSAFPGWSTWPPRHSRSRC